jgi:hypothetical protein
MQKLSLTALAREQLVVAGRSTSSRSASTVFGGHERTMRQTVIALLQDARLDEHENPGEATVLVLSGRVELSADGDVWQACTGDLLVVPLCATLCVRWRIRPYYSPQSHAATGTDPIVSTAASGLTAIRQTSPHMESLSTDIVRQPGGSPRPDATPPRRCLRHRDGVLGLAGPPHTRLDRDDP